MSDGNVAECYLTGIAGKKRFSAQTRLVNGTNEVIQISSLTGISESF